MAAAYAALVSLTHIIEQIMDNHARQPIFSRRQIESLQQKVSFLQDFLELLYSNGGCSSNNKAQEGLESRIADAAYAAEDIMESHVVNTILPPAPRKKTKNKKSEKRIKFTSHGKNSSHHFLQGLQKIIENIDCIRKEVMEFKEKSGVEDQQPNDAVPVVSSRPPVAGKDMMIEYYDDDLVQIMDKLTGQSSDLQIIPIVGMGGIGKTTLAKYVYDNSVIVEHFYIRTWVTVSQEWNLRKILLGLLHEIGVSTNEIEQENGEYHQLGETLYKYLSGRKYLIIMDDVWSLEAWEKLKLFLPDYNNGSRVMITTRLSDVANSFGSSHVCTMNLLDENKSWSLLCRKVFGHDGNCPLELEDIGEGIAKNCKGLPLSIVVIGGLLAKSEMTKKYWKYVANDINQIVNSEGDGHWLNILSLSYNHLPIHLKPCFLYMGIYPEDCEVRISELIKLWVAEGFLKPNKAQSLEAVAEDYLKGLVERNLIFVRKWGSVGKMKTCSIHDLIRDLCLKEAKKERFLSVIKVHNDAQSINDMRRIVFHGDWSRVDSHQFERALQSTTFIRSLSCDVDTWSSSWEPGHNLRLLRVLTAHSSISNILQLVNLRYLKYDKFLGGSAVLSSMRRLWHLQTLILSGPWTQIAAPNEIWEMPQLRHLVSQVAFHLPDPSRGQLDRQDDCVLKNLQTLSRVINFKCTDEVLKRIPNIKKLSIVQLHSDIEMGTSNYYCVHNLGGLHKLQSLTCDFFGDTYLFQNIVFPQSLKKLTLWNCYFDWDDLTEKVGSLPYLEKLRLWDCDTGAEWNTVEGKFICLKFLEISNIHDNDLVCWTADSTHFPILERLVLGCMTKLKEIPSGIGDTLQSIELQYCGSSIVDSAKAILEEQQSLGNEALRLTVWGARQW